jgi:hypothetical protein
VYNADGPAALLAWSPAREDFVRVGHWLLTLILAVMGGWTAQGLSRVRRPAT